ncbi:OsmC family protein [Pseudomonas sp. PSE14]|uniref:OsmC family protein n=1 Tax=Pseudomonas sp. PSE14 TaxID=3016341 RepID=UPI0023D7FBF0|nr:OsmC family protein [Pseudomonas sp. PSE14]WEJ74809.1 OsmC family protein [Pseudomonas sp. PSE14]
MAEPTVRASFAGAAFQVKLSAGEHEWLGDVPAGLGGGDTGPSPHQLLLSALGACTSITVAMYAQRKGLPLESIDVDLKVLQERPGHTEIGRDIRLAGALTEEQRTRLLEIANACPIHKVLSGEIVITSQLVE